MAEPEARRDVGGGEVVGVSAVSAEWAAYEEDVCGQWDGDPEEEDESLLVCPVVY
jgi:hypothetical protein